jgi:hypothetical protein
MVGAASPETRKYKEYELTAMQHAGGWQVHIYPTRKEIPRLSPDHVSAPYKEAAFKAAECLIDTKL